MRVLIWIEVPRFRGWGCSDCGWHLEPSSEPVEKSVEEIMRCFEVQRDKEFASHVCADQPGEVVLSGTIGLGNIELRNGQLRSSPLNPSLRHPVTNSGSLRLDSETIALHWLLMFS